MSTFTGQHRLAESGQLGGGYLSALGLQVVWAADPEERSGAGPQMLVQAAIERIKFLQTTQFNCDEFEACLSKLEEAEQYLHRRQQDRIHRDVAGTNQP